MEYRFYTFNYASYRHCQKKESFTHGHTRFAPSYSLTDSIMLWMGSLCLYSYKHFDYQGKKNEIIAAKASSISVFGEGKD